MERGRERGKERGEGTEGYTVRMQPSHCEKLSLHSGCF